MTVGDEPHLALGANDEWVMQLQTRLHALGLFDGMVDGSYEDATMAAVTQLQQHAGLPASGEVDAQTWVALAAAEGGAGLTNPFDPASEQFGAPTPTGMLSEDQQWRWDGHEWQPNEDIALGPPNEAGVEDGGRHLSANGQWLWDGMQWQPADGDRAGDQA